MAQPSSSPNAFCDLTGSQVASALVLVGVAALLIVSLMQDTWSHGRAPFPYAWRDALIVHVLCAVPLTCLVVAWFRRHMSDGRLALISLVCLGVGCFPFFDLARERIAPPLIANPWLGIVVRSVPALALTIAVGLAAITLTNSLRAPRSESDPRLFAVVGLVILVLLPWTYVGARSRKDAEKLGEYLSQMRIGEARTLANGLLLLDADVKINGKPLPEVAEVVNKAAAELEAKVAVRPGFQMPVGARLERAEQLAMLDRTDEAIGTLQTIREPAAAPYVSNLLGGIYETREEWEPALSAFRNALSEWEARPASPPRSAGILRAKTGTAYCLRKSGRYVEAEAVYQEVLALAPTADSHFLMAQFYEDAQQSDKARMHARKAIELMPDRYQQQGEKLIRKMQVFHFGCFGILSAEREQVAAPLSR